MWTNSVVTWSKEFAEIDNDHCGVGRVHECCMISPIKVFREGDRTRSKGSPGESGESEGSLEGRARVEGLLEGCGDSAGLKVSQRYSAKLEVLLRGLAGPEVTEEEPLEVAEGRSTDCEVFRQRRKRDN